MYCITDKTYNTDTHKCLIRTCFVFNSSREEYHSCGKNNMCYNLIDIMFFSLFGIAFLILLKNIIDYYIASNNLPLVSYSLNRHKYTITGCFIVLTIINSVISLVIINFGPLKEWDNPSKKHLKYNCTLWYILTSVGSGTLTLYLYSIVLFGFFEILLELYYCNRTYNRIIEETSENDEEV